MRSLVLISLLHGVVGCGQQETDVEERALLPKRQRNLELDKVLNRARNWAFAMIRNESKSEGSVLDPEASVTITMSRRDGSIPPIARNVHFEPDRWHVNWSRLLDSMVGYVLHVDGTYPSDSRLIAEILIYVNSQFSFKFVIDKQRHRYVLHVLTSQWEELK